MERNRIPDDRIPQSRPTEPDRELRAFARKAWVATLIVAGVAGAMLVMWFAYEVMLLFLAAVLIAIFFSTLADWIGQAVHIRRSVALGLTLLGLVTVIGLTGWLVGSQLSNQATQLTQDVPKAIANLDAHLRQYSWGNAVISRLQNPSGAITQTSNVLEKAQAAFAFSLKGVLYLLVVLIGGFYLACQPDVYIDGFLKLVSNAKRQRARLLLDDITYQLRRWLFGQLISMTIMGVLTWLGLFLLGIPAAGVLGVLAGLMDLIPVAGTFISGVVACIIAFVKSPVYALYVACLFGALHLLELQVTVPQVQRHAARMPPALTIFATLLFYVLFGYLGALLAVPLLALALIATKSLYIENVIKHPWRRNPAPVEATQRTMPRSRARHEGHAR
jgi:predicted PurR-regulated permease PerM